MLSSASDKAKLFAENFSLNSNLDDSGFSLLVFPSVGKNNYCFMINKAHWPPISLIYISPIKHNIKL